MVTQYRPLFDNTSNFAIGEPYWFAPRGERCCACEGYTYDGSDPRIQLPRGYHARLGDGTKVSRGVHQDCSLFQPDRIQVLPYLTEIGVPVNIIRLEGDTLGRTGGAMLIQPFDEQVMWSDGVPVRATLVFSPRSELLTERRYINFGLRGKLSFSPTKEDVEIFEVAILQDSVKAMWWHSGIEGGGNRFRKGQELQYTFVEDMWYAVIITLTPTEAEFTWNIRMRINSLTERKSRLLFNVPPTLLMNQGMWIGSLAVGDEHQIMTDGGVYYISKLLPEVGSKSEV